MKRGCGKGFKGFKMGENAESVMYKGFQEVVKKATNVIFCYFRGEMGLRNGYFRGENRGKIDKLHICPK